MCNDVKRSEKNEVGMEQDFRLRMLLYTIYYLSNIKELGRSKE